MAEGSNHFALKNFYQQIQSKFITFKGVYLVKIYQQFADVIENFQVYDDDVWVCSFPKSGTTWTQEMIWCIANNLDFEGAKVPIQERYPFFEFSLVSVNRAKAAVGNSEFPVPLWLTNSVKYCENFPRPRFIKSHLPFDLLPRQIRDGKKKPKIIYVMRNPKDVCVSFYHHYRLFCGYHENFDVYCTQFLTDNVLYAPYWNHVQGYWNRKDDENILIVKYEDMKSNLSSVIKKVTRFLNMISLTDEQVKLLVNHLSFGSMKTNSAVNLQSIVEAIRKSNSCGDDATPEEEFIRNGTAGQWKTAMDEKMIEKFDKWIEENLQRYNLKIEHSKDT